MIDPKKSCLVVVDVQGKLAQLMHDKESLFKNSETLIETAKALDIPILWCEQNPKALGPTIDQLSAAMPHIQPIPKMAFSCCREEKFSQALTALGNKHMILCGIESHICVYQTAMDLLDRDLEVTVVADAVSSRTLANKQIALERLSTEGANISCTEMLLFELLKTCEHEKFRHLARLIK